MGDERAFASGIWSIRDSSIRPPPLLRKNGAPTHLIYPYPTLAAQEWGTHRLGGSLALPFWHYLKKPTPQRSQRLIVRHVRKGTSVALGVRTAVLLTDGHE